MAVDDVNEGGLTLTFFKPITRLKLFLVLTGISHHRLARAAKLSQNQISCMVMGQGVGIGSSRAVEHVTRGWVGAEELYGTSVEEGELRRVAMKREWRVVIAPSPDLCEVERNEGRGGDDQD